MKVTSLKYDALPDQKLSEELLEKERLKGVFEATVNVQFVVDKDVNIDRTSYPFRAD